MSEPMTNREIEDVLTSIRRLVAQEGGRVENGRLILTEAQRVNALTQAAAARVQANTPAAPEAAPAPAPVAEPLAPALDVSIPAPDFGKLEATIAELEAAVSARGGTFEADGFESEAAEGAPRASNVTELYGRLSFAHRGSEPANDAPVAVAAAAPAVAAAAAPQAGTAAPQAAPDGTSDTVSEAAPEAVPAASLPPAEPEPAPVASPAPIAAEPPAAAEPGLTEDDYPEETILDEEALHALISQIVRDELRGQLGERITQQVRKLVRAEIARALEDRDLI